jgi:hypothetical protein
MNAAFQRLLAVLKDARGLASITPEDWDALLRHARSAGLLSRLALDAREQQLWDSLPERVRRHMESALVIAERQIRAVAWEVHKVHVALGPMDIPVVLLKGAAYAMGNLPAARGRLFGDIDLLVPRDKLPEVELRLQFHGWHGNRKDAYDQRYYREWMHEIPPVTHISRGSTLDVHHNILPLTARLKPRAKILLEEIVPLPGYPNLYRLGDADLVLHSATHLFHEGEWAHGLRDLSDLHLLLNHFARQPGFMEHLLDRARRLDLVQPLGLALYFVQRLLGPMPSPKGDALPLKPPGALQRWAFLQGFAHAHPDFTGTFTPPGLLYLYLRAHWLRMPPRLLLPHLLHKARKRRQEAG